MTSTQTPQIDTTHKVPRDGFVPLMLKIQIEGFSEITGTPRPIEPIVVAVAAADFSGEWLDAQYQAITRELRAQNEASDA